MSTIFDYKEQAVTETPILLFDCVLANGQTERWSTHAVTVAGNAYSARVLKHDAFELQASSTQGIDVVPKISLVLANADSHFSELERSTGWKGAKLTVGLVFYDLRNGAALTDRAVVFQGICNPPEQVRESTFQLSATNRMSLQRLLLPQVRIQRRCPWEFPATEAQRAEAVSGGATGKYSRYYRCGYSAGESGGTGSMNGAGPYTNCGYTRTDCQARGMFTHFGGLEFVPPTITVRSYGESSAHTSAVAVNTARYNDFVPMVYGTAWYNPPVVFARNDGNLTRMEVLLGIGEMQGVLTVLVNDIEIPAGVNGRDMTGTGWYNVQTLGTRSGAFDLNFTDGSGAPAGDPYGSMAYLSVVVPNRINDGQTLPRVAVLVEGLKIPVYAGDGSSTGEQFCNNPVWILLDILRRAGWTMSEIDVSSFATAAAYCDEQIAALDLFGNDITLARFQCNLALQKRKSAGDLVRGIRNGARMRLTYGPNGVLQLRVENSMAMELATKPAWSNSTGQLNGGWPSYEFGDGSNGITGISRKSTGEPDFRVYSRSLADTPNLFTVEFQDSLNEYQQDSYSLVDSDDVALSGQEITQTLAAIGLPNFDQAARILKLNLDKSVRGNTYIEFGTSVKAFGIQPGDLITVTYLKEGFNRQPFRVLKIAPGLNYRTSVITAQIHDDAWYADSNGQTTSGSGGRRQGSAGIGVPYPLVGTVVDDQGNIQFGIAESERSTADGTTQTVLQVSFVTPISATQSGPEIPLINLSTATGAGGSLSAGQTLYYAVSGVDSGGNEGRISFIVRATILSDGSTVTLSGLGFSRSTTAFHVYRGVTPAQLFRIATNQTLSDHFTDGGLSKQLITPIDPNFDHAYFYWRMELQPETAVNIQDSTSVGNSGLTMTANRYRNMVARITRGKGAGQERTITANSSTTLTVAPAWNVVPDASSYFVVAEGGWQFGALTKSSPTQFPISNLGGETVQVCGRSANVNDGESAIELSTVTRWQLGGSVSADSDVPATPYFGLGSGQAGGTVELSGVSFTDLTNTATVVAATLTMHYWNELSGTPGLKLALAIGASDTLLTLNTATPATPGSFIQVDGEVMRVDAAPGGGAQYQVTRGMHGSAATAHAALAIVYGLQQKTVVSSFPAGFFGSPYSGSWSNSWSLPDVRIASAELFVTNRVGNSAIRSICLTTTVDQGLRTLSGGQYSIEVEGYLAVQDGVAPAVVVDAAHSVKDVFAVLGSAADANVGLLVRVNGTVYCSLTIPAGATNSAAASGLSLGPLPAGGKITLSILTVGLTYPGADLTVLVRL